MRDFLKSTHFKIMCAVVLFLFVIMLIVGIFGVWSSPQSSILGAIFSPVQKAASSISESTGSFFGAWKERDNLKAENKKLKEEINELRNRLIGYDKVIEENKLYKDYLGIRDEQPDLKFEPAMLISRDPADKFYSFSIDKGSLSGIKLYDPVITAEGLVGYISSVSPTYSTVMTILDGNINISAIDSRTRTDTGVVTGSVELVKDGLCAFTLLPGNSSVAIGDLIVTTGFGGVFPKDTLIGKVKEIKQNPNDISVYAVVEPSANIKELRDVFVVKSFNGQGNVMPSEKNGNK